MDKSPEPLSPDAPFVPRSMGIKVGMLLAIAIIVSISLAGYLLHAGRVFQKDQKLFLIAEDAEGVKIGMDLTFAGFPIGKVEERELRDDGKVRIRVSVPLGEAKWLRTSSGFLLEVPLVGEAKLRAFSPHLNDPQLQNRAERELNRGDSAQEIPKMVASLRGVLDNVDRITDTDSSLDRSLANLRIVTERMAGKQGVLGAALGGEDNARKLLLTIDRANALLASLNGVSLRLDGVLSKTDQRVYGAGGIADETQKAVVRANAILAEVSASLKKVDAILADAQAVASNAKVATTDLGALRAEVEASLRKVSALIDEINRKWPFERDTKIKLP